MWLKIITQYCTSSLHCERLPVRFTEVQVERTWLSMKGSKYRSSFGSASLHHKKTTMQGMVWKFKCGMFCVSYRLIISEGYKKIFSLDSSSLVSSGRLQEQTFNQDAWCPEPQASSVWALGPLGDVVQIPASGSHQVISFEAGDTNHELFSYTYIVYVCASYARYHVLIMLLILSLITVKICCLKGVWSQISHEEQSHLQLLDIAARLLFLKWWSYFNSWWWTRFSFRLPW